MSWSITRLSWLSDSCGLTLLSKGTTSSFTLPSLPLLLMLLHGEAEFRQPLLADVGERPRKRVDIGDFDGLGLCGERNECCGSRERGRADHALDHVASS